MIRRNDHREESTHFTENKIKNKFIFTNVYIKQVFWT